MKRAYAKSQYAKPYERYCREKYPEEAERIYAKAEEYYLEFMKDMPDLGKNMMAKNMLDWFTILAFYEASEHRLDGEALLEIKRRTADKMKFLGKLVDGNRRKWPYRLFEKVYVKYDKALKKHQAKGMLHSQYLQHERFHTAYQNSRILGRKGGCFQLYAVACRSFFQGRHPRKRYRSRFLPH